MSVSLVDNEYGMLFATPGRVIGVVKGEKDVDSEVIFELFPTSKAWEDVMMVDGTEVVKYFVADENLPGLVVEILVAKLIGPYGDTETLLDSVGRVFSLDCSNFVDTNGLEVNGLPWIDIERVFVGSEPDVVLVEVEVNLTVTFVGVGFV